MLNITQAFYSRIKKIMDTWSESDIYAISFFVDSNESYEYKNYSNVSSFMISYNTEKDCDGADVHSEERWNYAFWRQDECPVIDPDNPDDLTELLFEWYKENGIINIGEEDEDCYDDECNYIGKGPTGHYELLQIASEVAKQIQQEGYLENRFGRKIPIIIHGLEYAWYDVEATRNANTAGEADCFFEAMEALDMI